MSRFNNPTYFEVRAHNVHRAVGVTSFDANFDRDLVESKICLTPFLVLQLLARDRLVDTIRPAFNFLIQVRLPSSFPFC